MKIGSILRGRVKAPLQRTAGGGVKRPARACHKAGEMNGYERDYAQHLEARRQAGEIREYYFEALKLRIGRACFYTPDFLVVRADDVVELHEVKGFWEEDARVKVKAVAALYPFVVVAVTRPRKGEPWNVERFTNEAEGETETQRPARPTVPEQGTLEL